MIEKLSNVKIDRLNNGVALTEENFNILEEAVQTIIVEASDFNLPKTNEADRLLASDGSGGAKWVSAINEENVYKKSEIDLIIGLLTNLKTNNKQNIVSSINELYDTIIQLSDRNELSNINDRIEDIYQKINNINNNLKSYVTNDIYNSDINNINTKIDNNFQELTELINNINVNSNITEIENNIANILKDIENIKKQISQLQGSTSNEDFSINLINGQGEYSLVQVTGKDSTSTNEAYGLNSSAFGYNNTVVGDYSFASGSNIQINNSSSFAVGKYNDPNEDSFATFIVGDGNKDSLKNLLTLSSQNMNIHSDKVFMDNELNNKLIKTDEINTKNIKLNGNQGSDGQVLTSTGSGIQWKNIEVDFEIDESKLVGRFYNNGTGEIFNDYASNTATGICSHAEGNSTNAIGECSHVGGQKSTAIGSRNFAHGLNLIAGVNVPMDAGEYSQDNDKLGLQKFSDQFIVGKNNVSNEQIIFAVGNGENTNSRSNIFEAEKYQVNVNGDLVISGNVDCNIIKILQEDIKRINNLILILDETLKLLEPDEDSVFDELNNKYNELRNAVDTLEEYTDDIESNTQNITSILSNLSNIKSEITIIKTNVSTNTSNIQNINSRLNGIDTNINTLNSNVTKNKNSITEINTELEVIETNIINNTSNIQNINSRLNSIDTNINTLNSNVTKNKNSITEINAELEVIETNIINNTNKILEVETNTVNNTNKILEIEKNMVPLKIGAGTNSIVHVYDDCLNIAAGKNSFAFGYNVLAHGENSVAFGHSNKTGSGGFSVGASNYANDYSFVSGKNNYASQYSNAENTKCVAISYSHAEGRGTMAFEGIDEVYEISVNDGNFTCSASLEIGDTCILFAKSESILDSIATPAIVEIANKAGNVYMCTVIFGLMLPEHKYCAKYIKDNVYHSSHAEGVQTIASGRASHAEGFSTESTAIYSHSEGDNTIANGVGAHAEGNATTASGSYSHAEGIQTIATGQGTHVGGYMSEATANYGFAHGDNTIANSTNAQAVFGRYNIASANSLLIVGKGLRDSRSNAFRVSDTGSIYGVGAYNTTGADYAEMFEWLDGNPENEDRVGYFVTLDGEMIRIAKSTDEYILGVVSAMPSVIGDNYSDEWHGKYITDEFGRIKFNEVKKQTFEINENGEKNIIDYIEIEPCLNEQYLEKLDYVSREQRQEWSAVGMVGKLYVRHDGTLKAKGFCKVNDNGIATKSDKGYYVMSVKDNVAKIIFR